MGTGSTDEPEAGTVVRGLLSGIIHCGECGTAMSADLVRGLRRYVCRCTRAVPADELDVIVLGRVYDRRRSIGATGSVRLCEESVLVDRFVRAVTVGREWTRPSVRWADAADAGCTSVAPVTGGGGRGGG